MSAFCGGKNNMHNHSCLRVHEEEDDDEHGEKRQQTKDL